MVLLVLIIIGLAFVPIVFVWLPIISRLWIKIFVTISALLTAIFMCYSMISYSDVEDKLKDDDRIILNFIDESKEYTSCIDMAVNAKSDRMLNDCNLDHLDYAVKTLNLFYGNE